MIQRFPEGLPGAVRSRLAGVAGVSGGDGGLEQKQTITPAGKGGETAVMRVAAGCFCRDGFRRPRRVSNGEGNATMGAKKKNKKVAAKKLPQAARADKYRLYEQSVQDTEFEYEFVTSQFRRITGRQPRSLREDFCGTAKMACEWVRRDRRNTAVAVDLDSEVLAWARDVNVAALDDDAAGRLRLIQQDVRRVRTPPVDVILAMNFSYSLFKTREELRKYFRRVRGCLREDGVFFIDAFGGYEAFEELEEATSHGSFTYVWDQHRYNPITGELLCYIHFRFRDGSKLERAFEYDWRLWTLPELQEVLDEAGFSDVTVYWQGTDEDGEPNNIFEPSREGEADAGWICFLSARR